MQLSSGTVAVSKWSAGLRSQCVALGAIFAVFGVIQASWAVRIPAIKQQIGASSGTLGFALLFMSAGSVAAMLLAGALCARFGDRRLVMLSGAALSLSLLLPTLAYSPTALALALFAFGSAGGCLNVAMNSVAVDLAARARRAIVPSFHAAWSFGALAGAGLGGLLAEHLSPLRQFSAITVAGLLVAAASGRTLLAGTHSAGTVPAHAGAEGTGTPWRAVSRVAGVIGLYGVIGMCALYSEGSIADWGALHLKEDLGAGAALAAVGYAVFSLAEATGRLRGTALVERYGPTRVLVFGGLAASAGTLLAALAPDAGLAVAGFCVAGLGLANLFPVLLALAGAVRGVSGVAAVSTIGYAGLLLGPPTIGLLAANFGLRAALLTLPFLGAATAGIACLVDQGSKRSRVADSRSSP